MSVAYTQELCHTLVLFSHIFKWWLQLYKVLVCGEHQLLYLCQKKKKKANPPRSLNEYSPVALTSLFMKSFEKIIKDMLLNIVQANHNPLQSAQVLQGGG